MCNNRRIARYDFPFFSVSKEGLEPSRACAHSALNAACLPIPPFRLKPTYSSRKLIAPFFGAILPLQYAFCIQEPLHERYQAITRGIDILRDHALHLLIDNDKIVRAVQENRWR